MCILLSYVHVIITLSELVILSSGDREKIAGEGRAAEKVHHYPPEQDLC